MGNVVTRFAPSPTGFLHIGGARTALFNWLLARHYGGKFLLRIEDTDRARSTQEAVDAIFDGLKWLGIEWDDEPVFQFSRCGRHVELAEQLVKNGAAYYCYCSPQELEQMREEAKAKGLPYKYNGRWRDVDPRDAPAGIKPVIRLKAPTAGTTVLMDIVQGNVAVANDQLDDMILVRSDGTPTFMLSVVVDDHDMGITHVIRGDDHLTNTFRQIQIYEAFGWKLPLFGHIPLIHGSDGAKLSKRHGALGVNSYRNMGFLPEALCNCLLRLGWSHGNDEIISMQQAVEWFTTDNLGKSPSRFDFAKLTNMNGHYLREADNNRLLNYILTASGDIAEEKRDRLRLGMNGLKQRAKTLLELQDLSMIYIDDFWCPLPDEFGLFRAGVEIDLADALKNVVICFGHLAEWTEKGLEITLKELASNSGVAFGKIAQLLRNILARRKVTPGIFEMLVVFGREESIRRIELFLDYYC
ncbi:MAG: glutamate--tRNA ligase [Holosporaceae bacterium]|jgi:glutamyl-tRNA synthetase|nr:glutamate--tRNA ligase [Holosporaceae bacterium]